MHCLLHRTRACIALLMLYPLMSKLVYYTSLLVVILCSLPWETKIQRGASWGLMNCHFTYTCFVHSKSDLKGARQVKSEKSIIRPIVCFSLFVCLVLPMKRKWKLLLSAYLYYRSLNTQYVCSQMSK